MKCLVTGGAGFIGSNLVDSLLDLGHDVIVVDNCSSGSDKFYWNHNAKNYKLDITNYDLIEPLFSEVDYVFHLAAVSRVQQSIEDPLLCVKTNVLGTAAVLEASKKHGVKRVVYSSTSAAYGQNAVPNIETQKNDCLNPYSASKVAGEELCSIYNSLFGLETISLRYFNVYGNRQPLDNKTAQIIGLFEKQKSMNLMLSITGDGKQRRDFVNVLDVVDANIKAAVAILPPHIIGTAFNIGSSINYSINDLALMFDHDVTYIDSKPGEVKENLANIDKAKKYLEWEPTISLKKWIKNNIREVT